MKKLVFATLILIIFNGIKPVAGQVSASDYTVEIAEAEKTRKAFLKEDPGLKKFFNKSYGYAILPKIGLAQNRKGRTYCWRCSW